MEVSPLRLGPDDRGHRGPAALRLLLPRPQGPRADAAGGGDLVGALRRDRDRCSASASWCSAGRTLGGEYFAGYITEKALSVDNLFVFLIIMSSFRVPREDQQKVLLFGIAFALVARTGFIFLGAALINTFAWVFYLFGLVLHPHRRQHAEVRPRRRRDARTTSSYAWPAGSCTPPTTTTATGSSRWWTASGSMTPMLLVMVAIGGTDILFALDSIPAIFGLTQNTYIVFTADGVLAARAAPAVLPHRGPARPADLPLLRARGDPGLHRGQADPPRPAREQPAVHQRRRADRGDRDQHGGVAERDPRRPRRHRRRLDASARQAGRADAIDNARRHASDYLDSEYTQRPRRARAHLRPAARRARPDHRPRARSTARRHATNQELMALLQRARDSHDSAVDRGEARPTGASRLLPRRD